MPPGFDGEFHGNVKPIHSRRLRGVLDFEVGRLNRCGTMGTAGTVAEGRSTTAGTVVRLSQIATTITVDVTGPQGPCHPAGLCHTVRGLHVSLIDEAQLGIADRRQIASAPTLELSTNPDLDRLHFVRAERAPEKVTDSAIQNLRQETWRDYRG